MQLGLGRHANLTEMLRLPCSQGQYVLVSQSRHFLQLAKLVAKLIVGCGYLGLRVARLWREAGEQVWVLTRSTEKAQILKREGLSPIVADIHKTRDLAPSSFPSANFSTILYSVGYDRQSPQPIEQVYAGGLANLLGCAVFNSAGNQTCRWIYISSTGVY